MQNSTADALGRRAEPSVDDIADAVIERLAD